MAKGKGISTAPPKPKVAKYTHQERLDFKSGKTADPRANKQPQYGGLNDDQTQVINNMNQGDIGLSGYSNGQLPGVYGSYQQPFDDSNLPMKPWEQADTIQGMEGQYYDRAMSNYDRSMADQYKQEDTDFDQQMSNRGIPLGSDLYNKLKKQTADQRSGAKQNAMDSAYFNAGQNATTWNNLDNTNFQNAYGYSVDQRNRPLNEYNAIRSSVSGMPLQNLGYSQAGSLADKGYANDRWMMQNTPRGGGGSGGGGGGAGALWQQYGFSSPMEYDAYKTNMARENALWDYSNNPQYRQPSGPSTGSQILGGLLNVGTTIGGMYAGKSLFG